MDRGIVHFKLNMSLLSHKYLIFYGSNVSFKNLGIPMKAKKYVNCGTLAYPSDFQALLMTSLYFHFKWNFFRWKI